jgi:hypothetical protein
MEETTKYLKEVLTEDAYSRLFYPDSFTKEDAEILVKLLVEEYGPEVLKHSELEK